MIVTMLKAFNNLPQDARMVFSKKWELIVGMTE